MKLPSPLQRAVLDHYRAVWRSRHVVRGLDNPPHPSLPMCAPVLVAEFEPAGVRPYWIYATLGMSVDQRGLDHGLELHLFSRSQFEGHVELLTAVAHYHQTAYPLSVGSTVNLGRSWLPGSKCAHGLVSLPYLYGPTLEWMLSEGVPIRCLWLIPIHEAERQFRHSYGLDKLECRFEQSGFDYLDPDRSSVVE